MRTYPADFTTEEGKAKTNPAYAYKFTHGATSYYFCNFDQDITITGFGGGADQVFTKAQIEHRIPEQTMSISSYQATIALAATDVELRKYFFGSPTNKVFITIYRINTASLPTAAWADDVYTEFVGVASGVGFNDYQISVSCISEALEQDGKVARFTYQKTCNHVLGGFGCGVNMETSANKLTTTISAVNRLSRSIDITNTTINGNAITATTFQGGKVVLADGTKIGVISTTLLAPGVRLRLQWFPTTVAVSQAVIVYRGCRHTLEACADDFNNVNGQSGVGGFSGFPTIPNRNPALDSVE